MRHEGNRVRRLRAFYELKNIGVYAFVPPVVVTVLLPAGFLWLRATNSTAAAVFYYANTGLQLIAPLLAAWWMLFVTKERVEGDGRELLYLLRRKGESLTALILIGAYLALLSPFALLVVSSGHCDLSVLLIIYAWCLFLASLAFWTAFVFHSSPPALVAVLAFHIVMLPLLSALRAFGATAWSGGEDVVPTLCLAIVSAGLLVHGEIRSRRFTG